MRAAVIALSMVPALSGCSALAGGHESCLPRISVSPSTAVAGGQITLASSDVCGADVPAEGWTVEVGHNGRALVSHTTLEPFDGSFELTIDLPRDFPEGLAFVHVDNWDYSSCDDTGSCASIDVGFEVVAQ